MTQQSVTDWLLEGDPAGRWQAMRDLLDRPVAEWREERARVASEGWGAAGSSNRHPGASWFEMGQVGQPSRWTCGRCGCRDGGRPNDEAGRNARPRG
jgi:hypothetical protein